MLESFEGVRLIINADDLLLSRSVDLAIVELFNENAISNTTAMMCLPDSEQRLHDLSSSIDTRRIGVHLQLTSGKPLSSEVPSLINPETLRFASKENLIETLAEDVEREWRAQISHFRNIVGHMPSHLDSHHGPHKLDHLLPIYLKLAKEFDLPIRGGDLALRKKISHFGLHSTPFCLSNWTGQGLTAKALMERVLRFYSPERVITLEVISHPSLFDPELRKISSLNDARFNDYSELLSFRKLVNDEPRVTFHFYEARQ